LTTIWFLGSLFWFVTTFSAESYAKIWPLCLLDPSVPLGGRADIPISGLYNPNNLPNPNTTWLTRNG
jgi:hypothetical protein